MAAEKIYYEMMVKKADQQFAAISAVDDKINRVLAFATSVLPVFVALLIAERDILDRAKVSVAGVAGGICYMGIVVFLLRAYQGLNWEWRPNRDALHTFARANDEEATLVWVADEIRQSLDDNRIVLEKKVAALNLSLVLLPLEIVALAAATVISLFRG